MSDWGSKIRDQEETISQERIYYPEAVDQRYSLKFFEYLSLGFLIAGFIGIFLAYFTKITLVQATCMFVISYVVRPSDGDMFRAMMKGIATDLGYIRANTTITGRNVQGFISRNQKNSLIQK